jgi:hypothetical protein
MPTTSASKNDAPATTSTANTANCHRNVLLVSMRVPLQNGIFSAPWDLPVAYRGR